MPRPRKPSKILERTGAFRHNPQRRRSDAQGVGTLPPEAPMHLELARQEALAWKEIAAVIPPGVVTDSERFTVELAARLLGRLRKTGDYSPATIGQLRLLLGSLGLTPSDRARLAVPGEPEGDDGFEEFSVPPKAQPSGAKRKRKAKALKFPDPESR